MGNSTAPDLNTKQRHQSSFGNAVVYWGKVTPASAANTEVIRVLRIPGGNTVIALGIINDDLDSNGAPAAACKVGYTPVDAALGPTANDAYWAASGQTFLQAANHTLMKAQPITFNYDVYVDITMTASAATFASGAITAYAICEGVGR